MTMIDVWESIKPKTQTDSFVSLVKRDLIPTIGKENLVKIAKNYAVTKFTVYDGDDVTPPYTPTALIKEITDKLTDVDFSTAKFLVIYTVEWANYLHAIHGVPAENITLVGDSKRLEVGQFAGYNTIMDSDFLSAEFNQNENMKFDVVVGNPPYNDGSINNTVLWDKFIVHKNLKSDNLVLVIPSSFLSQKFNGMSKSVKESLMLRGCNAIVINDYSTFQNAKVKTCTVFCKSGHKGQVKLIDGVSKIEIMINLNEQNTLIFNPEHVDLVKRVEANSNGKHPKMLKWIDLSSHDKSKWAIGSYYKTEGFESNPLKAFKILDPSMGESNNYYVVFGIADTEEDAKILYEKLVSFWFSDIVQAYLILTRYSISLDRTQYSYLPFVKIDHVFTNEEISSLWGISTESVESAKILTSNCHHKKNKNSVGM